MSLSRPEIEAMKESDLREKVLVPLVKAMGYKDVFLYHGGAQELGKDIVMWKPGDFAERVNYAVVAKAEKVSGKITGKSGAGEVRTQIEQCFGASYTDPVDGTEQRIAHCIVVSSALIGKEAVTAITGARRCDATERYSIDPFAVSILSPVRLSSSAALTTGRISLVCASGGSRKSA